MSDSSTRLSLPEGRSCINLRGKMRDPGFLDAVAAALGQALPVEVNTLTDGEHRCYWLGPDEWLVTTDEENRVALLERLSEQLAGRHTAINDVTGGNVVLHLEGPRAREILATGCTLDLDAGVFQAGACAQSGLAKAGVLIGLLDDTPRFELIVRRSFADYLQRWLRHAGRHRGLEFA